MVTDIGDGMVVKYGRRVRPEEAQGIELVATKTSGVPVPKVYSVIRDDDTSITYIVQEKLKGTPLMDLLPTLSSSSSTSSLMSSGIFCARSPPLTTVVLWGRRPQPLQLCFHRFAPYGDWVTPSTQEFVERLPNLLAASELSFKPPTGCRPYDYGRNPIFSHGDFVPENILIHEGRVSGIIDGNMLVGIHTFGTTTLRAGA
ncbi:hypothetical protein CPB85DRAFT_998277 [Mucidula mucida]|nr:hypothetical protein CPB85DRAFT_998277 [Mucidula mucida]